MNPNDASRDQNDRSAPRKDAWSKIADELNEAENADRTDWIRFNSQRPQISSESADGSGRSNEVAQNESLDDKIDEDYETRSRNRTRSVWNRGEWSSQRPERGRRFENDRPRERPVSNYDEGRRRNDFRPDRRVPNRPVGRGDYGNDRNGTDNRFRPIDGGYRQNPRGGYPRRETGEREDPRLRYGARRGDGDFSNGADAERGGYRRQADERRRPYPGERRAPSENFRRGDSGGRNDRERDYGRPRREFGERRGELRRPVRRGRRENLEPTIGALGKRGEPLSLAEELAARRYKRPNVEKYLEARIAENASAEAVGVSSAPQNDMDGRRQEPVREEREPMEIVELEKMTMRELVVEARRQNLETNDGEKRRDLILRVLRARIQKNGMMYGEGTLEILPDEFGFLRSPKARYVSCPDDVYVSPSQIRRFGLRTGLTISGQIRPPKERERYFALLRVESINGEDPNLLASKPYFDDLITSRAVRPLKFASPLPDSADEMETPCPTLQAIDKIAPMAFGQRALLVCPEREDEKTLANEMAKAVLARYPDVFVFVVLIDKRPETIAEAEQLFKDANCEVIGSAFDEPPIAHIQTSEIAFEKAKRMVEYGRDVVLVVDSLTRLARAWNAERSAYEAVFSGVMDPLALQRHKRIFSSARQIDGAGSLTVLAAARPALDNEFDQIAVNEFREVGNAEIWIDESLANEVPILIDAVRSSARDVKDFLSDDEFRQYEELRVQLKDKTPLEAARFVFETTLSDGANQSDAKVEAPKPETPNKAKGKGRDANEATSNE